MKTIWIIVSFVLSVVIVSCGSGKPDKLPSSNQNRNQDQLEDLPIEDDEDDELQLVLPWDPDSVILIFEGGTEYDRQFVFIPNSNQEEYLRMINDFSMPTKFETSMYRSAYSEILEQTEIEDTLVIKEDFPTEWLTVNWYDDDYYLYCPSRLETNYRVRITDSSLMVFNEYGVNAELITWFEEAQSDLFSFNTRALDDNENVYSKEINVYFIEASPLIAIWEEFSPDGVEYRLMIPAEDCKDYPIIVNYGEKSKPDEFDFETINYFEEIVFIVGGD